jgi:hypothetical protein
VPVTPTPVAGEKTAPGSSNTTPATTKETATAGGNTATPPVSPTPGESAGDKTTTSSPVFTTPGGDKPTANGNGGGVNKPLTSIILPEPKTDEKTPASEDKKPSGRDTPITSVIIIKEGKEKEFKEFQEKKEKGINDSLGKPSGKQKSTPPPPPERGKGEVNDSYK